jgi:hypothetical protein
VYIPKFLEISSDSIDLLAVGHSAVRRERSDRAYAESFWQSNTGEPCKTLKLARPSRGSPPRSPAAEPLVDIVLGSGRLT